MDSTYRVNQDWRTLANRIVKPQKIVIVIGTTDTGKSTFCRFLVDAALAQGLKTGFVDTDVGQSHIGPPTTIGMKSFTPEMAPIELDGTADQLYFVGNLSPRACYLETLTGTRLMVDGARETEADFIVVDTSGYIYDPLAVILKQQKIELIKPHHLVGIGRSTELDRITTCYNQQAWIDVHYLLPPRGIQSRSRNARRLYRKARFDAYFSESSLQQIPFEQIRGGRTPFFIGRAANEKELKTLSQLAEMQIHYAEWGHRSLCLVGSKPLSKTMITHIQNYLSLTSIISEVRAYFQHRLVGLINSTSGNTDAIGVIEKVDFQKREFSIRCPSSKGGNTAKHTCVLQFGGYQLK